MAKEKFGEGFLDLGVSGARDFKKDMKDVKDSSDGFGNALKNAAKIGVAAFAALSAAAAVALKFRAEQEKAEIALSAALARTNEDTKKNIDTLHEFASALQQVTIHGDESILESIAFAKNLGVQTDQLETATLAAIGFAASLRIDLKTAMQLVARAAGGNTTMFTRYGIQLDMTKSKSEQFEEVLRRGNDAMSIAMSEAQGLSGSMSQLTNDLGDTAETVGGVLQPAITGLIGEIRNDLLPALNDWLKTHNTELNAALMTTVNIVELMAESMVDATGAVKENDKWFIKLHKSVSEFGRAYTPLGIVMDKAIKTFDMLFKANKKLAEQDEISKPIEKSINKISELEKKVKTLQKAREEEGLSRMDSLKISERILVVERSIAQEKESKAESLIGLAKDEESKKARELSAIENMLTGVRKTEELKLNKKAIKDLGEEQKKKAEAEKKAQRELISEQKKNEALLVSLGKKHLAMEEKITAEKTKQKQGAGFLGLQQAFRSITGSQVDTKEQEDKAKELAALQLITTTILSLIKLTQEQKDAIEEGGGLHG